MRARRRVTVVAPSVVAPDAPTLTAPAAGAVAQGAGVTVSATVTAGQVPDRIDFVLDPGPSEVVVATDSASPFSQTWTVAEDLGAHTLVARFVYGSGSVDSAAVDVYINTVVPAFWLDGATVAVADGAAIATWPDSSGAGNDAVQATAAEKPTFRLTGGSNSLPCVETDGAAAPNNDNLQGSFTLNQPVHLFVVMKALTAPSTNDSFLDGASGNTMRLIANNATDIGIFCGTATLAKTTTPTSWHIYEAQCNGASSKFRVDDGTYATGNSGAANPGGITIGCFGDGSSAPADARFAEIIGFAEILDAAGIAANLAYLRAKHGI